MNEIKVLPRTRVVGDLQELWELFIITRLHKGSCLKSGFGVNDQVGILDTVAASEIPKGAASETQGFPLFLKGPPVGSSGEAMIHLAVGRDSCGT